MTLRKYATIASFLLAVIAAIFAWSYRSQLLNTESTLHDLLNRSERAADDYQAVSKDLDKLKGDLAIIENPAFRKVVMKGTANDAGALASVYWNEQTQEAYISIQSMKAISSENQFQLWAIVKGKWVDTGVFDMNFTGLLKMKNIAGAAAFAVTVEPRGGREIPTYETMQVIGAVDRRNG